MTARSLYGLASAAVVTTIFVFGIQTPSQGQAGANKEVRVINTASEAVPTAIVGTPTVTIASMPSVTISGIPEVRDADAALRTPYKHSIGELFSPNSQSAFMTLLTVPAGKRFVLDGISATGIIPAGQKVLIRIQLDDDGFDQDATFVIPLTSQGAFGAGTGGEHYTGSEHFNAVLSAGGQIIVHADRDGIGSASFEAMVVGYFEDVP